MELPTYTVLKDLYTADLVQAAADEKIANRLLFKQGDRVQGYPENKYIGKVDPKAPLVLGGSLVTGVNYPSTLILGESTKYFIPLTYLKKIDANSTTSNNIPKAAPRADVVSPLIKPAKSDSDGYLGQGAIFIVLAVGVLCIYGLSNLLKKMNNK